MHMWCGGIFNKYFAFTGESDNEKIRKIGCELKELWP